MSIDPSQHLNYLKALCRKWGWDLVEVTDERYTELRLLPDFAEAPFTCNLGIWFMGKQIVWNKYFSWTCVVHEMAHVFATTSDVYYCNELDFFGWEYQLAITLNGVDEWIECNSSYGLGEVIDLQSYIKDTRGLDTHTYRLEFAMLSKPQRDEFLNSCLRFAEKSGLIINGEVQNISKRGLEA